MELIRIGTLRRSIPRSHLFYWDQINKNNSKIYVSDRGPNKSEWKQISLEQLPIEILTHDIYIVNKNWRYYININQTPLTTQIKEYSPSSITQHKEPIRNCSTCTYNDNNTCHFNPPPFIKINDDDWCSKHLIK